MFVLPFFLLNCLCFSCPVGQDVEPAAATKHPLVTRQPTKYVQLERDPEIQVSVIELKVPHIIRPSFLHAC